MTGRALLLLQAAVLLPAVAVAQSPFGRPPVSDAVLADQRGGIRLPNGIDVSLSIDTVTAVDGRVVLQTVTRIAEGAPIVAAYAPKDGMSVELSQQGPGDTNMSMAPPRVSYDRQHGLTLTVGMPILPVTVARGEDGKANEVAPGLQALDLSHSATTPNGVVQALGQSGLGAIELQGMDIRILHLTGNAIGSAILNTGNDRAIDTLTTLSIDLRNAGPDVLGSTMLRVEEVAIGAMAARF